MIRIALVFLVLGLAASETAASSNLLVRVVSPDPPPGVITLKEGELNVLVRSASSQFGWSNGHVQGELIAWSLKLDHLGQPPRLFEEAVVLLEHDRKASATEWGLRYLMRMPGGMAKKEIWRSPHPSPPLTTYAVLEQRPSDKAISEFIRSTDFGHNCMYPRRRVVDVVLYRQSEVLEEALRESIPSEERQQRYARWLDSMIERKR